MTALTSSPCLRSLPSAIDDALATLYEPNAIFRYFLGSASMTFFLSFPFLASSSCLFLLFLSLSFCVFSLSYLSFLSFPLSSLFLISFFYLTRVRRAYA